MPPDAALAVAGRVDPAVRAALAEARRIRDGWQSAVAAAEARAAAQVIAGADSRWRSLQADLANDALHLAQALAARLGVQDAHVRLDSLVTAMGAASTLDTPIKVRVSPGDLAVAQQRLPGAQVQADPALAAGQVAVDDPHGLVDARVRALVAALATGP